jgi:hypothetical protein
MEPDTNADLMGRLTSGKNESALANVNFFGGLPNIPGLIWF